MQKLMKQNSTRKHHVLLTFLLALTCASAFPRQVSRSVQAPLGNALRADASETSLKIVSVTKLNAQESVDCNANNQFPVGYKVVIQNSGTATLTAGDANYSLSIINHSNNDSVIFTQPITQTLAAGAKSDTITLSTLASYKAISSSSSFYVKENISGTTSFGSWISPVPYEARPYYYSEKGSYLNDSATIDFGMTAQPLTTKLSIRNLGAAAFSVTGVTFPNGFSLAQGADTISYPIAMGAHQTYLYPISLTAATPGSYDGMMTISTTAGDMHLHLTGTKTDDEHYLVNFEDGKIPVNFMQEGDMWSMSTYPTYLGAINNGQCVYQYDTSEGTKLITPLLQFAGGEALLFQAAMVNTASHLNVYYSKDRHNWTLLKHITADATNEADRFSHEQTGSTWSSYYNFKTFKVNNIPAGNYYIAFEAGGVYLDNIYGGRLASVTHDMAIASANLPAKGMVNYPYQASVTFKNLNTQAENVYKVALHLGNEVQEAGTSEIAAGSTATFNFSITPHEAASTQAFVTFTAEDYSLSTDTVNVEIAAEEGYHTQQTGLATVASGEAPINMFYKKNTSEMLYTAGEVALPAGTQLTGVQFKGFLQEKDLLGKLRIYVANTTDTELGTTLSDTTAMTLAYANDDYVIRQGGEGSSSYDNPVITTPATLINAPFSAPFTYTGGSLRIVVRYDGDTYASGKWQATEDQRAIIARADGTWSTDYSACSLPVAYLTYNREATLFSGTVTDSQGSAMADVTVQATCGDVVYSTTTDAQGAYSMNILQDTKTYKLSYTKTGYMPYKEEHSFAPGSYQKNVTLQKANGFYIDQANLPAQGNVNSPYTATVKALNPQTSDVPSYSYKATLYFDKKAVAEARAMAVKAGETANYTFTLTPHEAGTHKAYVLMTYGNAIASSDTTEVTIAEEAFGKTLQIGDSTDIDLMNAPVNTYNNLSEAIIVYPAKLLGLQKGALIKRIQYRGYVSSYNNTPLDVHLRAYMQNSDIETFTKTDVTYEQTGADTTAMTKVFDGTLTVLGKGSKQKPEVIISLDIPGGFRYTGKSILLYFSNSADSYRSSYYISDQSKTGYVLTRNNDYELPETFKLEDSYGLPVTLMETATMATAKFNVTNTKGQRVNNAKITLKSGDVEYYGQTKGDSACLITVGRTDLTYQASLEAEGYEPATINDISFADSLTRTLNVTLQDAPDTITTVQPAGQVVYYAENARNLWQSNGEVGDDRLDHKMKMMVRGNDGYIYIKDFMDHLTAGSWIKGRLDGDTLRFKLPQPYYEMGGKYNHREYSIRAFNTKEIDAGGDIYITYEVDTTCTEMKFYVHGDSLISANKGKLFGLSNETYGKAWSQFAMGDVTYYINHDANEAIPADAKTEKWSFEYAATDSTTTGHVVDAAIKDGSIYVKGLSRRFPEAVVKGELQGNKAVFDSRQYLAADSTDMYYAYMMASKDSLFEVPMGGYMVTAVVQHLQPSITFSYDATAKRLKSADNIIINHGTDSLYMYDLYKLAQLNYFKGGIATPANPEWISCFKYTDSNEASLAFNLYPKDIQGNFISPDSLYYIIYTDNQAVTLRASDYQGKIDADLTQIPYYCKAAYVKDVYHGLRLHNTTYERIGLQAVYHWNGEEMPSDIVYYGETTGITGNQAAKTVKRECFYDLSGRMVEQPSQGIFIKVTEYADGTKSTKKIVRK